jgi:hypothetical protein
MVFFKDLVSELYGQRYISSLIVTKKQFTTASMPYIRLLQLYAFIWKEIYRMFKKRALQH